MGDTDVIKVWSGSVSETCYLKLFNVNKQPNQPLTNCKKQQLMCWNMSSNSSGGQSLPWLGVAAPGQKSAQDEAVLEPSWQRSVGSHSTVVLKAVCLWVCVSVCGLLWQFPPVTPFFFPQVAMKRKPNLEYHYGACAST